MELGLWTAIQKSERGHDSTEWQLSLNGQAVSSDSSNLTISSQLAPVWVPTLDKVAPNGVWYCLATYTIRLTLPKGCNADDDNATGSRVSLGDIKISVEHDRAAQPLDGLVVSVEHAGPKATSSSKSISNTVSKDVGVNIGAFGDQRKYPMALKLVSCS